MNRETADEIRTAVANHRSVQLPMAVGMSASRKAALLICGFEDRRHAQDFMKLIALLTPAALTDLLDGWEASDDVDRVVHETVRERLG